MDVSQGEVCSSSVTGSAWSNQLFEDKRRKEAVDTLKAALAARGTVLSDSSVLWIAANFEKEIFESSQGSLTCYESLLAGKLEEIGGQAGRVAPVPREYGATCVKAEPADVMAGDDVATKRCGESCPVSGFWINDAAWDEIQMMKGIYSKPLQASYAAIVDALHKNAGLQKQERQSLASFKRLVLGLVVFLAADRAKIPPKFDVEKLGRLEREVVQILATMLRKALGGVLRLGSNFDVLTNALKTARFERHLADNAEADGKECSSKGGGRTSASLIADTRSETCPPRSVLGKRAGEAEQDGASVPVASDCKRSRTGETGVEDGTLSSSLDSCAQHLAVKLETADAQQEVAVHHPIR